MTLLELRQQLESAGFKIERNPLADPINLCDWHAYRPSQYEARECECNLDKTVQLVVTPFSINSNGYLAEAVEVDLCGQYDNWWKLKAYSLSFDELLDKLPSIEARLVRAWNAL